MNEILEVKNIGKKYQNKENFFKKDRIKFS